MQNDDDVNEINVDWGATVAFSRVISLLTSIQTKIQRFWVSSVEKPFGKCNTIARIRSIMFIYLF